ncbi:MAG: AmmeMemoRadiSam system protein B [Bacillota bacterium]|nr:AmmeMemoRadiSam system protein B [Bacillota bacterium]
MKIFAVIIIIGALFILLPSGKKITRTAEPANTPAKAAVRIKCNFYDEKDFRRSVMDAKNFDLPSAPLKGGIVPHHLLAGNIIASFFSTLSLQKPELVIVIAPNHDGIGANDIQTGSFSWETPFGILDADLRTVKGLIDSKAAAENNDLMQQDHSISGLVPYIKYYMPDAKIEPVMLRGSMSTEKSVWLGNELIKQARGRNFVVIASIDFSHYLPGSTADKMDEITLKAIKERDLNSISNMGNDNLDSPPSLICFLSAMKAAGAENFDVAEHNNSDKLTGSKTNSTTSYFSMLFY